jgi:NodT family efflux transporter outer membrane factor (OMF) lipoprotein
LALALMLACSCRSWRVRAPGRPSLPDGLPDSFASVPIGTASTQDWWRDFGSSELSRLVDEAFAGNLSLAEAVARLRQAEAVVRLSEAALRPDLTGEADASVSKVRDPDVGRYTTEGYSLGLVAGYEVDMWGRLHAVRTAQTLNAAAMREDVVSAALALAAEITSVWLALIEWRGQASLLEEQLQTNRASLDLLELRHRKGMATALDVYQQRQIAAATEALMPQVQEQIHLLSHQLCIMLGRNPGAEFPLDTLELPRLPSFPEVGIPAVLLEQRPDVQAAFFRLGSADWQTAAARADRLPALRLTGALSYRDDEDLNQIFDNWIRNLAASLTAPLLDGGRRKAEVARAMALADERLAQYTRTVLDALREVQDAIARERFRRDYLHRLQAQLDNARATLSEAGNRYRKGLSDYLPVLTALDAVQRLERTALTARRQLLDARVALYRSLGGTWQQNSLNTVPLQTREARDASP